MKTTVILQCSRCGQRSDVPKNISTWVCPSCGKNMERDLLKALRSEERWEKRQQQWARQDQRIADKKAAAKKAAEQQQKAFSEAHKDDTARICESAHKLIKESGFPYRYTLPIAYPTKGRVLLVVTESVASLPFEESGGGMNWQGCSLRRWLNNDFLASLPDPIKARIVLGSRKCTGRNGRGLFCSNNLTTAEKIFVLGKDDLNATGKPLHESCGIKGPFWLRDEFSSSEARLGGNYCQDRFQEKYRKAAVVPAMLLQIE